MMLRSFITLALAAAVISCSSNPPASRLTVDAARSEAQRDIASGHIKIYFAGTEAAGPVGADAPGDWALISKLPQDHRLSKGSPMTQFVKGTIQATLITGTALSVMGTYMFAIFTAMGRKQGLPLRPKWYLPLFDYVFFPSRLAEDGLRARKRCFLSAGAALFFILCDILVLWTRPI